MTIINSEDEKLMTLATSSLLRNGVRQSAALRDGTGRTHVGNAITLTSLKLDALQVALAMAISSGATEVEAAVVVGDEPTPLSIANIREVSGASAIWHATLGGVIHQL